MKKIGRRCCSGRLFDLFGSLSSHLSAVASAVGYITASWRDYMKRMAGEESPSWLTIHSAQFSLCQIASED
jgi:hypothetical protein